MSDIIISGRKLSRHETVEFNELRNSSSADRAFIPGIISGEANIKIPIGSFVSDSWKDWSERHGSSSAEGSENSYYIGSDNYVKNGVAFGDNNFADGSYNIGQGNSAKGGVYVIGNNNNANYEEKYDADGNIIDQNTNTTIFGDNNYTENYIGEYSAISAYKYWENGQEIVVTGLDYTGKTRSLIIGNDNSAIGWNCYSFGEKNFNGSTIYAYNKETSSYNTSGLGYTKVIEYYDWEEQNYKKRLELIPFLDDHGYTLTYGHGNSATRYLDMAIGVNCFASGGENIVIGSPTETHTCATPSNKRKYTAESKGCKNLNIRSKIDGVSNKAFESYLETNASCPVEQIHDNILEYSDILLSGKEINIQFRRNNLNNAKGIIFSGDANLSIMIHNNEFEYNDQLKFTNINSSLTADSNTFIKTSFLNISSNYFNNNNFYAVCYNNDTSSKFVATNADCNDLKHITKLNIVADHLNGNNIDNVAKNCWFNIYAKNGFDHNIIKNSNYYSDIDLSAYDINENIICDSNIPAINCGRYIDYNGNYTNSGVFDFNIIYNIIQSSAWNIKSSMSNNILLNAQTDKQKDIILENPKYVGNNIIINSLLSATSAENRDDIIARNIILNASAIVDYNNSNEFINSGFFVDNFLFNAKLDSESAHNGLNDNVNNATLGKNVILGSTAKNVQGSFIVSDGENNNPIEYCNRVVAFGDQTVLYTNDSTYFGTENSAHFNDTCFVAGEHNAMTIADYTDSWYEEKTLANCSEFGRCFILGVGNELVKDQIKADPEYTPSRNYLIGNVNKIYVSGKNVNNNILFGDTNIIGYCYNVFDGEVISEVGYTENNDRNTLIGSNNKISKNENDNIIIGSYNLILNDNDDIIYSNNILFGLRNIACAGSNQINIGLYNTTYGHYSTTIGNYLIAAENQYIVGQYNEEMTGYTRTVSAFEDGEIIQNPIEGVIFAIGNGRLNAYELNGKFYSGANIETDEIPEELLNDDTVISRSNAMVVSADGTVSARTYRAAPNSKLDKLFEFLSRDNVSPSTGALTWDGDDWHFV